MDKLNGLRKQIDTLDSQLIQVLYNRLKVVDEVGKIKKKLGLKPLDPARWNIILEKNLRQAESLGLRRKFIKKILDTIHEEALLIEK